MSDRTLPLPLETERLLLRWYQDTDLDQLATLQGDPAQVVYVPFGSRSEDEVVEQLAWRIQNRRLSEGDDRLGLAVTRNNDGAYLGDLLLFMSAVENKCGEIGYMLLPQHQGHGYMTEAVSALLAAAFATFDLHRIVAHMDARNKSSAAVAERVGMRREAHFVEDDWFKGEWSSTYIYAILRREWASRRG